MHQVDGGLPCYSQASAAKPAFGSLQQGGMLGESGMLAEPLLHLLAKTRDELPVARADRRGSVRDVGHEALQIREQRGERSAQRQASAWGGAAEFAQQHSRQGAHIRLAQRGTVQHGGDTSLEVLRQTGTHRAQLARQGRCEGDHDTDRVGLKAE